MGIYLIGCVTYYAEFLYFSKDYNQKQGEGLVVNFMGVMILLFGMGVLFMLSKFKKDNPSSVVKD